MKLKALPSPRAKSRSTKSIAGIEPSVVTIPSHNPTEKVAPLPHDTSPQTSTKDKRARTHASLVCSVIRTPRQNTHARSPSSETSDTLTVTPPNYNKSETNANISLPQNGGKTVSPPPVKKRPRSAAHNQLEKRTQKASRIKTLQNTLPIYIPSKGRAERPGTWDLLLASAIPFTIVVEPQDYLSYQKRFLSTDVGRDIVSIVQLPLNDQGVCYVRNFILHELSPVKGWFWCMDDDIQCFGMALRNAHDGVIESRRIDAHMFLQLARPERALAVDPHVCLIGIEYEQFAANSLRTFMLNSYVNICFCMDRARLPHASTRMSTESDAIDSAHTLIQNRTVPKQTSLPCSTELRYRFPIREDYDMCLQIMRAGGSVFRNRHLWFRAPQMGTRPGGMTDFYKTRQAEIRRCNARMVAEWGPEIVTEVQKGRTEETARWDLRIRWNVAAEKFGLKIKPGPLKTSTCTR